MALTIRQPTVDDAAAIAGLLDELGYPSPVDAVAQRLVRMLGEPGQSVIVALDAGQLIGLATVIVRHVIVDDAPFARLAALVVTEGQRGRGVGTALVTAAEGIARSAGCTLIEVTSGDRRPAAHDFYRRLGFTERPRRFVKRLGP
ncbi:MAG: GNAT family N-acetyltransferase [Chloroflexota bacterium]|nr:GNAT family N-acetyltransferase [Chloroflexota bacterium]